MQTFQPSGLPSQGPKNYVFVDEHNRHKRLKVMRACEGCRKRKIKCDAATTNTWPCAACKRLKLTCVPPVGGNDGDLNTFNADEISPDEQGPSTSLQQYPPESLPYLQTYNVSTEIGQTYSPPLERASSHPLYTSNDFHYGSYTHDPGHMPTSMPSAYPQERYSSFDSINGMIPTNSVGSPQSTDSVTAEELAENLGELRIPDTGIAPYIRQQNESQREAPAPILEDDENLPALSTKAGSQVRIPPALMPSNEEATRAFQDFFRYIHPYAPVLCRGYFYSQWQQERSKISPLLLAAVLACAGQVSEDPAGGSQWLALANRHEENFADTPRLSTIQALLLLLKARERTPKKGYYYRSWVLVKKIVGMAKDLDLHEHFDIHQSGGNCDSTQVECLCKTRIWQTIMIVEIMIGGPQGRYDYGVELDTIDTSPNPPNANIDDYEKMISRQYSYYVKNIRNIRGFTEIYYQKRKNKDWATDPKFVAYNEDFRQWPEKLPTELQVLIPADGSRPNVPSHFVANMHCHYQLGIVMLYKPQLTASKDFNNDDRWKYYMSTCYDAAKKICVLQEAVLESFDLKGLASLQRGFSFHIYAILSCTMVHLIAITSPDPAYNLDARNYFIRHMRILEVCIKEWPMPEVEAQIYGLRAAFSADLNKPFDLKPSFPYSAPSELSRNSEERRSSEPTHQFQNQDESVFQNMPAGSYFSTPPMSAGPVSKPYDQQFYHEYDVDETKRQYQSMPPTSHPHTVLLEPEQWNPTPIINQFNTAFAIPQSALAPPPHASYGPSSTGSMTHQAFHAPMQSHQFMPSPSSVASYNSSMYTTSSGPQIQPNQQARYSPNIQDIQLVQPAPIMQHYPQQQVSDSYLNSHVDAHVDHSNMHNSMHQSQLHEPFIQSYRAGSIPSLLETPGFVTPKQWQQSVAKVFDPNGLKRKWNYEHQPTSRHQEYSNGSYGGSG